MSRSVEALLVAMRKHPDDVRFEDAVKVISAYFGEYRQSGSHRIWKMPWPGDPRINIQETKGGKAKPYQVRQALGAIDRKLTLDAKTGGKK